MSGQAAVEESTAPRTALECELERLWAGLLGRNRVGVRDRFFDLGGHSLLAAELFARIETAYGVRLPFDSLFPEATLERQAVLLEHARRHPEHTDLATSPVSDATAPIEASNGSAELWRPGRRSLVPIQPRGHRAPLLCVHAIDGDVLRFEPLARRLGPDQPVYGLRARGLDPGSEPATDIPTIAAEYIAEVLQAGWVGPFALLGFSSGCTVAYEMACQLGRRGYGVGLLALLDGDAPRGRGSRDWIHRAPHVARQLLADLGAYLAAASRPGRRLAWLRKTIGSVPVWLRIQLHGQSAYHAAFGAAGGLSARHVAVALAHSAALKRYTPPRDFPGSPVSLFRARLRPLVGSHDRCLGWDRLAKAGVEVHAVEGEHAELLREPYVGELARLLRAAIDRSFPTSRFVEFEAGDVEQSIAARFERQVDLYPNQVAIKGPTRQLTYLELNRLANRVAHRLIEQRPNRGSQVGLLFEQPEPMIAASLGALKAGRPYVTLDPTAPRARQAFILADAEVGVILADAELLKMADELADGRVVIDVTALAAANRQKGSSDRADPSANNPRLALSPDAYTYIVYTSGSTGQPKGVVENQRNVLHFTRTNTNLWRIGPDDRICLLVPYWFSAAATATFGALLNGATLLPASVKQLGLLGLASWLEREQITIFHTSTSLFRHFMRALPVGAILSSIRMVYQGSEALFQRDVELYRQHFGDHCLMANQLGASEMKIFSCLQIDKRTRIVDRVVPVGYALPDVEVLVVGEDGQSVPAGTVGEIVVRSRFIAPGYWQRPELTARTFRADPTGEGRRLYFTGDLGWLAADGCLHHVGRRDFQVKIRGYRVELGEITAALLELPTLADATVVASNADSGSARANVDQPDGGAGDGENENAGPRLVAYVVPAADRSPTAGELRSALATRLPDYMLPSVFITLGALPRNPNGKVDTTALPPPP